MVTLQVFSKGEEASGCAAYLLSCGIQASVIDEGAIGGNMLGLTSPGSIRVEVPEEQLAEARDILASLPESEPPPAPAPEPPLRLGELGLIRFFRTLLVVEGVCSLGFTIYEHLLYPEPPAAVVEFQRSLAFSDWFWMLSYVSYWPLTILCLVANVLCFFFVPFGRRLFVAVVVWSVITSLGPPPYFMTPLGGFLGSIQNGAFWIPLALMYWSPLRARFDRRE